MNPLGPWRSGTNIFDEIHREFDSMLGRYFGSEGASNGGDGKQNALLWSPRVDISETETAVIVKADIPGVDPKDIDVSVHNGVLTLRGEKSVEKKEEKENFHRTERFFGQFFRSIALPEGIDPDKVNAECARGVVTVTIPRKPSAQPKKIAVKASE